MEDENCLKWLVLVYSITAAKHLRGLNMWSSIYTTLSDSWITGFLPTGKNVLCHLVVMLWTGMQT